jgi:hypothetical protein
MNDDLSVVCRKCRSYIQAKVDTIDLFAAIWGLMEHPRRTFKKIVLARQKNFVIILSMAFGIALILVAFRFFMAGRWMTNVASLLGVGFLAGPLAGILVAWVATAGAMWTSRRLGGTASMRNLRSVFAYSVVPIILALIFVFPIEFGVFGKYLFDQNPPPAVIDPILYYALLAFHVVAVAWTFVLFAIGAAVANCFVWWKGVVTSATVLVLVVGVAAIVRGL